MEFIFDDAATVEATAYLLQRAGGRMNYTVLLKLLYLADRKALASWGSPITGAHMVNMDNGPVLSEVYDLIKGNSAIRGYRNWSKYIAKVQYDVALTTQYSMPLEELSEAAREILDELFYRFGHYTYGQMIDYCHKLPEWHDPDGTSVPLAPEDILRSLGNNEETIKEVARDSEYYTMAAKRFRFA